MLLKKDEKIQLPSKVKKMLPNISNISIEEVRAELTKVINNTYKKTQNLP